MIVDTCHRGGALANRRPEYLTRVHEGGRGGTRRYFDPSSQSVAPVQAENPEFLDLEAVCGRFHVGRDDVRTVEKGSLALRLLADPPEDVHDRDELDGLDPADSPEAAEFGLVPSSQFRQRAGSCHDLGGEDKHVPAAGAAPDDERENLRVAQAAHAQALKPLLGSFARRHNAEAAVEILLFIRRKGHALSSAEADLINKTKRTCRKTSKHVGAWFRADGAPSIGGNTGGSPLAPIGCIPPAPFPANPYSRKVGFRVYCARECEPRLMPGTFDVPAGARPRARRAARPPTGLRERSVWEAPVGEPVPPGPAAWGDDPMNTLSLCRYRVTCRGAAGESAPLGPRRPCRGIYSRRKAAGENALEGLQRGRSP